MNRNRATKRGQSSNPNRNPMLNLMQPLEPRRLLSVTPAIDFLPDASSSTVPGYSPSQIAAAYGFSGLTFGSSKTAANGTGQTIAIVDAYNDPNIAGDLKTFDGKFGLATANLKVVNQTGGSTLPATNGGWAQEISLDVEWAHAIAPGASLLLVETNSAGNSDLLAGVNYARSASGVSVVSMSWGGSEFNGETGYDSIFTTPSGHNGVTFIAASGDNGSFYGADWPASSPYVLSVGGTSLSVSNSTGTYSSETGWSDSGGGVSQFEDEPEYQSGVQSLDQRTVPDVAADANPNTGVAVYDSYSYDGVSGWVEFGGTSAAAPQWAGLISIADQGRMLNKLGTLDGSTNTLPTLYDLEGNASSYSADFHDITSGATSYSIAAGTGYDLVTGIGSAKANNLIPALVSSTVSTKLTLTAPPPPVYYFPPPRHGWYFVATSEEGLPTQLLVNPPVSFTTTLTGVGHLQIEQSLFAVSLPQPGLRAIDVQTIDIGQTNPIAASNLPANGTNGGAGSALTTLSLASQQSPLNTLDSNLPASQSAIQTLEQDLLSVSMYAQEMTSQLGRDLAIDLAHGESTVADSVLAEFTTPGSASRVTSAAISATLVAIACLQGQTDLSKPKKSAAFSGKLIEPFVMG